MRFAAPRLLLVVELLQHPEEALLELLDDMFFGLKQTSKSVHCSQ